MSPQNSSFFPENLGKFVSDSWGSLFFEFEVEVVVDGHKW